MSRTEVLQDLKVRFGKSFTDFFDKSPKRVYIEIEPTSLVPVATYIFRDLGARFHIASGVDVRSHLEILYHFSIESLNLLISLRVRVDFEGHPDPRRLLLADEWPQGVYPLRADYKEWDKKAIRDRGV
jgi:NADH-quinone oxidoreductase subunit C